TLVIGTILGEERGSACDREEPHARTIELCAGPASADADESLRESVRPGRGSKSQTITTCVERALALSSAATRLRVPFARRPAARSCYNSDRVARRAGARPKSR